MLIALAGFVMLGLQAWSDWTARATQLHEKATSVVNLAVALTQHADDTIEVADTAVSAVVSRLEANGTSPGTLDHLSRDLAAQASAGTRYLMIAVLDVDGNWLATSRALAGGNVADRAYFSHHRDNFDRGPFVGPAIRGRPYGNWNITVSRRFNSPTGTFAGVVVSAIDLAYFVNHYATYDLGRDSSISLSNTDGTLLARYPSHEEYMGQNFSTAAVFGKLRDKPIGSYTNTALVDGIKRITGYRSSNRFPLVAVAAVSEDYTLSSWRRDTLEHMLIAATLVGLVGLLSLHLVRTRDLAERATRAKSRFLAAMSHELRTPLNCILGYTQLLRLEGDLNSVQGARIDAMLGAGTHLLDMIQRVLDISAIESGHVALALAPIDLPALAGACVDLVRPASDVRRLALDLVVEPGVPSEIYTDPVRLKQLLVNLLGNAVKFTAQGGVQLRVGVRSGPARLRFEVIDTGPGVPVVQRRQLFVEFNRLDTEATAAVEGAGFGLALSARLATLLGGCIGYADNPAGGSIFWLELPLVEGTHAVNIAPPEPLSVSASPASWPLRVLVVDDIAMNRDIAGSFIRAAGHHVTCVENGADAIEAAGSTDFDVIMMDVRMPEMDGLEATRRIRRLTGTRGKVAVLGLTAQAFAGQVAECYGAGMDGHVVKPFTLDILLRAITDGVAIGRERTSGVLPRQPPKPVHQREADASPSVVGGLDQPLLDLATFDGTAGFLAPDAVTAHLRTLSEKSEALIAALSAADFAAGGGEALAAAAHTLAGSAGMFGFQRLEIMGRHFEQGVAAGAADLPALADALRAVIEATLPEMRCRALLLVDTQ